MKMIELASWWVTTPGSTNIAGWNGWTRIESMYFPLKMGDSPACYVGLPEGTFFLNFLPDPLGGEMESNWTCAYFSDGFV